MLRLLIVTYLILVVSACANQPSTPDKNIVPKLNNWNEYSPGANTSCSNGSDYKFYVREANPNKLLVYLAGGGACWSRETCDPTMSPSYRINIPEDFKPSAFGIFNFDNQQNPFADYTVVMAPYCSGDVHLGQSDTVYPAVLADQSPLTIRHRGRANMQAVLDWTYQNIDKPQQIFVTGSSAGAIPSPFYASLIADHYTEAKVTQLGDAAGGYRRTNFDHRPNQQWGTFSFINQEKGFEKLQEQSFNYEQLYIAAAKAHPQIQFAQYDAAQDAVQKRFLELSGSKGVDLKTALVANHQDIKTQVSNFASIIGGGASHTILLRPEFYQYAAQDTGVRNWISDLASNKALLDVSCIQCSEANIVGAAINPELQQLWDSWHAPKQYVEPFKIFDNLYYVGIDFAAAYILKTNAGLILIDSLYGNWVNTIDNNMRKLGLDPADIKYVINTHGHFDHAGGSRYYQQKYGARIVMTEQDWQLVAAQPEHPLFYVPAPSRDVVAKDGDVIHFGDTAVELYHTPGHTEGVLSLIYPVKDGDQHYQAITLGGVGLNFSGVERTQMYLSSYRRLQDITKEVSVSLPNHAFVASVFEKAAKIPSRKSGQPHPLVDAGEFQLSLKKFIGNAELKLAKEKSAAKAQQAVSNVGE